MVIVVSSLERAERAVADGKMGCPRCQGRLRWHGHGRPRTVRGLGGDVPRVTPRRVRCADCGTTQILLPTALTLRRADTTEVIGVALAAKAAGAGFRTIAARLGRPPSTVRAWLRRAPEAHAQWLYQRGVERAAVIDRELLNGSLPCSTVLGSALDLLAGAAVAYRQRAGLTDPPWTLIGFFARGRLLAPPPLII